MFVKHRFELNPRAQDHLQSLIPKFGYNQFGLIVFFRTYSRIRYDGGQENWADCVIRVTNGTFSIRKDFYIKNHIPWDEPKWQEYATKFALFMFMMKWMPPGRGLWMMGNDFMYERGGMALYNCSFTFLGNNLDFADDIGWLMDCLMCGVGVGFAPIRDDLHFQSPAPGYEDFIIPDTREGWVEATQRILQAFIDGTVLPNIIYDYIRPKGMLIKGFGGIASGPEPLIKMHKLLVQQCYDFASGQIDVVEFKTNVANMVGACVVAGNLRRSAEIAIGKINDKVFLDLKNYKVNPHRESYGGLSNNTVLLYDDSDFDHLGEIAERVIVNAEPGVANLRNFGDGRIGKKQRKLRKDIGVGLNPCGEIILENKEVCNVAETFPTVCEDLKEWYQACEYATFYCTTVALLPTHQHNTNKVVARNRRIGVGIVDFTGWKLRDGVYKVTKALRRGYNVVTDINKWLSAEAGVPEAIRKTTVKPGGSVPKLPGKTSGCGHPTFIFTLRRIRIQQGTSFYDTLVKAGIPHEPDLFSDNTEVFEYPIKQGPAKSAEDVSIWESANNVVLLQREWADNAVSNTIYFRPKWKLTSVEISDVEEFIGIAALSKMIRNKESEYIIPGMTKVELWYGDDKITAAKIYEYDPKHEEDDIEPVLSSIIPLVKSVSLLPHTAKGVYKQTPEEGISEEEYNERLAAIEEIDWSELRGSDGMDERYCSGDACETILRS